MGNRNHMYILGILNDTDGGVALLKDGRLIFAINEERLSRVKKDTRFPIASIKAALRFAGITLDDIDVVSYSWFSGFPYEKCLHDYVKRAVSIAMMGKEAKKYMLERVQAEIARDVPRKKEFEEQIAQMGLSDRIEYFDHHASHAASAYFMSPFKKALVITLDARGNFRSSSVHIGNKSKLQEVACDYSFDSLGYFYGQITTLLGYKAAQHEGKITGLAAYGDPSKCLSIMRQMVNVKKGKIYGQHNKLYKPFLSYYKPSFQKALKKYSREDISAATQKHFEKLVVKFVSYYVEKYKIGNLVCGGGIFANVKANQRIRAIKGVKDLFIFPNMGDGGEPVGAALLSWHARKKKRYPLKNVYLGPSSSNAEVEKVAKRYKSRITITARYKRDALLEHIMRLLDDDTVIGLFQGRMEFGPRALGNRSILYHARDKTVNDWLNRRLRREEFMPFAPVTTVQLAPRCFIGWKPFHLTTRYMTECYDCTKEMKKKAPAVIHVDGTARPQVISRKNNPFYFDIVNHWHQKTQGLCLINTSFNEHEEPIVCTIEDAIKSLLSNKVDCVVANGRYIISKR